MKNIFIVAFLFYGLAVFSAETADIKTIPCTKNSVPIRMKNFWGMSKKETEFEKQVAELVNPSSGQISSYDKSFEIGKFRFVRNKYSWDIYRKNDNDDQLTLIPRTEIHYREQFAVNTAKNIWVTIKPNGVIHVRRNVVGLENEFEVHYTSTNITLKNSENKDFLRYMNCTVVNLPPDPSKPKEKMPSKTAR